MEMVVQTSNKQQELDEDKAVYEESILVEILGENYDSFIDKETGNMIIIIKIISIGEWINEDQILTRKV